jgi:hypothetical protein
MKGSAECDGTPVIEMLHVTDGQTTRPGETNIIENATKIVY